MVAPPNEKQESRIVQLTDCTVYDGVLPRYQSIWSRLNGGRPEEEAPPLYIQENADIGSAGYSEEGGYFRITDKLFELLTIEEVDAVLYHEMGHQILGHSITDDLFNVTNLSYEHEFAADSVATVHGYGKEFVSALEKMERCKEEVYASSLSGRIAGWLERNIGFFDMHPETKDRAREIERIDRTYCTPPPDMQEILSQNKECIDSVAASIKNNSAVMTDACEAPALPSCLQELPSRPITTKINFP